MRADRTLAVREGSRGFDPATGNKWVTHAWRRITVNTAVDSSSKLSRLAGVEPAKRAVIIRKFCEAVSAHADELCRLITLEHGKTLLDAQGELQRGIENMNMHGDSRTLKR
ncbi:MAG: hypothetical protein Ct9H300mP8_13340 [Gammaproteobacteria bacterium]|nr:MAG: hypothetical protein Ct9H300mP8_13340 [Gammaproteobacteria bacterium]